MTPRCDRGSVVTVELRQLQYVVAVADHLHFGRAAASLHTGQPAVSQQIRRLERELGTDLFDRSGRQVRLTAAGAVFVAEARTALAAVDRAADAVRTSGSRVRIGTSTGLGDRLEPVLRLLRTEWPDSSVELEWFPRDLRLSKLASGQLDAAFFRGAIRDVDLPAGLIQRRAWNDDLVAAVPESFDTPGRLSLKDLRELPLQIVQRALNPVLHDVVVEACELAGFTPIIRFVNSNAADSLAMIGSGISMWTVLYAAHARTVRPPGVRIVDVSEKLSVPTYFATGNAPTARVQTLLTLLEQ